MKIMIQRIKYVFYAYYLFLILCILYFLYQGLILNQYDELTLQMGDWAGIAAVFWFGFALLPGMLGRFGMQDQRLLIIRQLRGNIGIAMFTAAMLHYILVKIIPTVMLGKIVPLDLFELFGLGALLITFALTVTSNKMSMQKLGGKWKKLHSLVYLLVWLIFAHVALQEFGLLSVGLLLLCVAEMTSLVYQTKKRETSVD